MQFMVCLSGRIRNGRQNCCFIVSLARRYDYSGTEDMATFIYGVGREELLILRVELAVFASLLEAQAARVMPNYIDFTTPCLSCPYPRSILRLV